VLWRLIRERHFVALISLLSVAERGSLAVAVTLNLASLVQNEKVTLLRQRP
jgi:hypothetical protein